MNCKICQTKLHKTGSMWFHDTPQGHKVIPDVSTATEEDYLTSDRITEHMLHMLYFMIAAILIIIIILKI